MSESPLDDVLYCRVDEASTGLTTITITQSGTLLADFSVLPEEADTFENAIARRANNRNKKIAAARQARAKKIRTRAHMLFARDIEHDAAWAQAEKELGGG